MRRPLSAKRIAGEMGSNSMRLVCRNGPGCKNHNWDKPGAENFYRVSSHGMSASIPVGGGY